MSSVKKSDSLPRSTGRTHRGVTHELAAYATHARFASLPESVRTEAVRAFANWVGCALGGCREPAVEIAAATVADLGGSGRASVIGHQQRTDVASASFVNCVSSSVNAFDDAHLATVTHPTGPVASALFATSETQTVSGEDFITALALGMEIECRLSTALVLSPAKFNVGFYVTGLSGPIGTAIAVGKLFGLDEQKMRWAIGIAASQASGFRSTHGTMTAHFRPGHAARSGVWAAMLAAKGFDCSDDALEAEKGFADVFSVNADLDRSVRELGRHFELLSNAYKPYPCGIVIHPTVDACLEINEQLGHASKLGSVTLRVHPLALTLTGIRTPSTPLESHVSLFHWAAAALVRGSAGLPEMRQDCIDDPEIAGLRARIEVVADPDLSRDEAIVDVTLMDGQALRSHIPNARGSRARPMTDDELDAKFSAQAALVLPDARVSEALRLCKSVCSLSDVGQQLGFVLAV